MTILFVLLLIVLLGLLTVILLYPARRSAPQAPRVHREKAAPPSRPGSAPPPPPTPTAQDPPSPDTAPGKPFDTAAFRGYPGLQDIAYSLVDRGVLPTPLEEIDEGLRKPIDRMISHLRGMPTASLRLYNQFSSPKEIAAIVSTDPVLSARVLRTINSAYYNLPKGITSVGRAIILLGYNNVRSLVIHDTLLHTLGKEKTGTTEDLNQLWIHSTAVSACAQFVSSHLFRNTEEDMGTIGLLHDIGKYFLQISESTRHLHGKAPPLIQEEKQYGVNHAAMGSLLARNWKLSDAIIYSIEYHHHPIFFPPESIPEPYLQSSFILCLADLICKAMGFSCPNDPIHPIRTDYFDLFGLDPDVRTLVSQKMIREVEKAAAVVRNYITN